MSDSNPLPHEGWLKIDGNRENPVGTDLTGLTVMCPFRGCCALSTCLRCAEFCTLALDASTRESFVVCPKAGGLESIVPTP